MSPRRFENLRVRLRGTEFAREQDFLKSKGEIKVGEDAAEPSVEVGKDNTGELRGNLTQRGGGTGNRPPGAGIFKVIVERFKEDIEFRVRGKGGS